MPALEGARLAGEEAAEHLALPGPQREEVADRAAEAESLVIRQWVSTNSDTKAPSPAVIAAFGTSVTKRGAGLGVARAAR
jgi:hypothetical protein